MKQIPLSKGKFALVDEDDFEFLNQWKWQCMANGYAVRGHFLGKIDGKYKSKIIYMHRFINKTPDGLETDHINNDRLDNRKANLRTVTRSQNGRNVSPKKTGSSKYKGVSWHPQRKKWVAWIKYKEKQTYLGIFKSEVDAALAYNFAAIEHFGEHAGLNKT